MFCVLLEHRPVHVADRRRETGPGRHALPTTPPTHLLDQRPHRDQIGFRSTSSSATPPPDLGVDGLVVERRGSPIGELAGVEDGARGVAGDQRGQRAQRREHRQHRAETVAPAALIGVSLATLRLGAHGRGPGPQTRSLGCGRLLRHCST